MAEQTPSYPRIDPANPNQRTPCVLVLDASGSMTERTPSGARRIDELNRGLRTLEEELKNDPTAVTRVQLAIVCVGGAAGGADVMMDWTDATYFKAFDLNAQGLTPLGRGMEICLDLIEQQKLEYKQQGIGYTRPWVMVMSDGQPTDDAETWRRAAARCRAAEEGRHCIIYPIGVQDADTAKLQEISATPVLRLDQLKFVELFQWLGNSLGAVSRSRPGETVQLPSRSAWEAVKL
jgi:uncharacterized protein YegL